jgi:hypothetical protein
LWVFALLVLLAVPLHQVHAQGTRVYTVDRASNALREISPSTGATISSVAITVAGSTPPTIRGATGLATDPTNSRLYALLDIAPIVATSPQTRQLASIDPNTGVATLIGSPLTKSFADITFAPDGTLYAVTGDGSSTNPATLYTMIKTSAAIALVAALGNGDDGEVIAFNPDESRIYHMSGTNELKLVPPPAAMVFEKINPASPGSPVNIPLAAVAISEATAMVYQGSGVFLWIDIFDTPNPPPTSRLLTMTTGGAPVLRGSLTYAATGIAIVSVFNLTVDVIHTGAATGTVSSVPLGVTCGSPTLNCPTPFVGGTQVTLTATPGAGSVFTGWGGACSGTGACVVDVTGNKSVSATFSVATAVVRSLSVTVTGPGSVTSTPAGTPALNCTASCTTTFADGTPVTLAVAPNAGSSFVKWGGACSGFGACALTMTADRTVSATFGTNQTLTVTKAGAGTGTVTSDRAGISCGSACSASYGQGTDVVLSASAAVGSVFGSWSVGCTGTAATCLTTMNGSKTVTATFNIVPAATPDFTFGPTPDNQTVDQGDSATYTVTINGTAGFTGTVVIGCVASTLLPSDYACTNPAPASISLTPGVSGTSTGTSLVTLSSASAAGFRAPLSWMRSPWTPWLAALAALLMLAWLFVNGPRLRFWPRVAALTCVLLAVMVISGCEGENLGSRGSRTYLVQLNATGTDTSLPSQPQSQRTQIVRLTVIEPP